MLGAVVVLGVVVVLAVVVELAVVVVVVSPPPPKPWFFQLVPRHPTIPSSIMLSKPTHPVSDGERNQDRSEGTDGN